MMPDMYYTVSVEDREMIAASEDPGVARYWAVQYTKETGGRAVVCKAMEFYAEGHRIPQKDVDNENFKP